MKVLDYMNIKNVTNTKAEIYFYGSIEGSEWAKWDDADKCPQDVLDVLNLTEGKDLDIYINSPGGSVFAGLAIYNMLCRKPEKKTCYIDGVAASIASVICMAADEIIMPNNSFLMIHKPMSSVYGNADEFKKAAKDLEIIQTGLENAYKTKLQEGIQIEVIRELMAKETWLNAFDTEKYFNVKTVEENTAVAMLDTDVFKNYKNVPDKLSIINKNNVISVEKTKMELELELMAL